MYDVGIGVSSRAGVPTLTSFFLSQGPLLWFIHGIPEKLVVIKCRKSASVFHLTSPVILGYWLCVPLSGFIITPNTPHTHTLSLPAFPTLRSVMVIFISLLHIWDPKWFSATSHALSCRLLSKKPRQKRDNRPCLLELQKLKKVCLPLPHAGNPGNAGIADQSV